jgi:hypothetical protein
MSTHPLLVVLPPICPPKDAVIPPPHETRSLLQLPPPRPTNALLPDRTQDRLVAALVRALIADRLPRPDAPVFGVYAVPCWAVPRHWDTVELVALPGGLRAACTCDDAQALEFCTPERLLTACWHVQVVLWFLTPPAGRACWTRLYPALAAAWADCRARRQRELAVAGVGVLAYQATTEG